MLSKELIPFEISPYSADDVSERRESMPPPICGVGGYFIEEVKMRDGVKLLTKVCVPDTGEAWPTLFTRTPYEFTWESEPAIMVPFIEQGYCVVIQSCRGMNGSEGQYEPFQNEREDGIDALKWLAEQAWHNGNIGLYGSSYMCYTQWIIADQLPPEVKTLYLDCFGIDRYSQMYMNGMFRPDIYTSWALTNSQVEIDDMEETFDAAIKMWPHNTMDEKLLGKKIPFYQDYIAKTERNDPYWKNSFWEILRNVPAKINVPVCIAEGWNDHNVEGVMVGVKGLRPEIREQSMIAIGAWDHFGMLPGELEYPDAMKHGHQHVKLMFGWLERMLKGKGKDSPPVSEVYVLGEGKWHDLTGWPPKTEKVAYYPGSGKTFMAVPANAGRETYLYDPENPVATVGGNALLAWMGGLGDADHGPMLQPDYADRNDVLMFKSEPLNETLTIMGGVEVFLEVSTSAPDTAFMVKLSEEFADGRTINIVDGASSILLRNESEKILDYSPGEKVVLKIRLWDVAWQVQKGSRLRFDVTSSNFPMYHIHSNRAGIWSAQEGWDKAEQTVFFGNDSSVVYLPVWKN